MTKVTLANVPNLIDATTAQTTINNNSAAIVTAVENTLSRDGTSPNQMGAALDMNSNRIVNLPEPISLQEPLRLQDLDEFVGGSLNIESIPPGGLTDQILKKNTNTSYDVSWVTPSAVSGNSVSVVSNIAGLKAVDTTLFQWANLTEAGRVGQFVWTLGNFTTHHATDTNTGVYVKANAVASATGSWVRVFDFQNYYTRWFGTINDNTTDNTTVINTTIAVTDLYNTLTTPGKQSAAWIHVEGGVRFNSADLSFLPSADNIFVYLCYFSNSDRTKGVSDGGGATNEYNCLSVNSGYPGDPTGAMVAEWNFQAPLHPAIVLNAAQQVDGADAHFLPVQRRIPDGTNPTRASYNFKDNNVLRCRWLSEGWGDNATILNTGSYIQPFKYTVSCDNIGSNQWPLGGAVGARITGLTSGAVGIVFNRGTNALDMYWVHGDFQPGEQVTDGSTTSPLGIGGGGVAPVTVTNPFLTFGVNNPCVTYGVLPSRPITGFDIGARLTLRQSTGAVVGSNHKETVTNPSLLWTNTADAVPTTGRQIVLNSSNRLVTVGTITNGTGSVGTGLVGGAASHGYFTNAASLGANSFNAASVVRNSTGIYTVAFTNALLNADYSVSITKSTTTDYLTTVTGRTTAGFVVNNFNSSAVALDLAGTVYFSVIGGQ